MKIFSPLVKSVLSLLPQNFYWRIPFGVMKGVRWRVRSANSGQALGWYENDTEAEFIHHIFKSSVFWDVGANVGWFSIMAVKLNSTVRVIAFEPDESNLQHLKQHKSLNSFDSIDIIESAVGSASGKSRFTASHQQGRLSDNGDNVVDVITADEFIDTEENAIPDFIKLDIEGGESDFLIGAVKLLHHYQPTLLLSAHGYQKRDECKELLMQYNYRFKELVSDSDRGDYVFLCLSQE